jgi:microsomal dipeptidase-like Zn-dependent dipeptidase
MPKWFEDNRDFPNIKKGLQKHGFSEKEVAAIMGENWLNFYDKGFSPQG